MHSRIARQGLGVLRINCDGPAVVLNGQAELVQIGVGAAPAVVSVAVVRGQLDKMVEVQNGLLELLALDARKGPGGPGAGVAGFDFQGGPEVFDGLVVYSQGDVGRPPGDEGDRVVGLEAQGPVKVAGSLFVFPKSAAGDSPAAQAISIFTAVLGAIAAFLALAEKAEVGALNLGLWAIVGLVVGLSAFSVSAFMLICPFDTRRMRRTLKPSAP